MTAKKNQKKFTVAEFKTWLEGIMQFQNDDWSPNREQWDEIYSKIMNLKEPVNKEKMGLNANAIDEINDIVYFHITDTLRNQMPHSQQPQQPQQNFGMAPQQQIHNQPQMDQNTNYNSQPSAGMENLSLSEIKKRAEEKASGIGGQQATHKLPDHTNNAQTPEDFV